LSKALRIGTLVVQRGEQAKHARAQRRRHRGELWLVAHSLHERKRRVDAIELHRALGLHELDLDRGCARGSGIALAQREFATQRIFEPRGIRAMAVERDAAEARQCIGGSRRLRTVRGVDAGDRVTGDTQRARAITAREQLCRAVAGGRRCRDRRYCPREGECRRQRMSSARLHRPSPPAVDSSLMRADPVRQAGRCARKRAPSRSGRGATRVVEAVRLNPRAIGIAQVRRKFFEQRIEVRAMQRDAARRLTRTRPTPRSTSSATAALSTSRWIGRADSTRNSSRCPLPEISQDNSRPPLLPGRRTRLFAGIGLVWPRPRNGTAHASRRRRLRWYVDVQRPAAVKSSTSRSPCASVAPLANGATPARYAATAAARCSTGRGPALRGEGRARHAGQRERGEPAPSRRLRRQCSNTVNFGKRCGKVALHVGRTRVAAVRIGSRRAHQHALQRRRNRHRRLASAAPASSV
jgi:hypothetical protein